MNEGINHIVSQVKQYLMNLYGEQIKRVIVYGSQTRKEATRESDIDILVVVDESINPYEVRRSLSDFLYDILLEKGELVSVIVVPEDFFESYNSPFILNVKSEGVAV